MNKLALGLVILAFSSGVWAVEPVGGATGVNVAGGSAAGAGGAAGGAVISANAALIAAGAAVAGATAAGSNSTSTTTHH